ncbi:MAG: hypothetical protein E7174_02270 [Firmicutes bacterium]|nr:hypothetical protein [Bacillota bacterium]
MKKDEIINFLESLVFKRFKSKAKIYEYIKSNFKSYKIMLEYHDHDLPGIDYNFIGTIENKDLLCDFDLYYTKTKANEMLIVEVAYEFQ